MASRTILYITLYIFAVSILQTYEKEFDTPNGFIAREISGEILKSSPFIALDANEKDEIHCNETVLCQNGGSCLQHTCHCLPGTNGSLCEIVNDCANKTFCRLNKYTECSYNVVDQKASCHCNSNKSRFDEATRACQECVCGNHSLECDFKDGLKVCTCEDGYIPGNYEICTEMCSDTKKCQNGGTCYSGICRCPPRTTGTFCEKIKIDCWSKGYYEDYSKVRGLFCCCKPDAPAKCKYDTIKLNAYCECPKKGDVYDDDSNSCKECNCGNKDTWTKCDYYGGVKTCFCKKNYEYNPKTQTCEYCNCGELSNQCQYSWGGFVKCTCLQGAAQYKNECQKCDCGENGVCELREGKPTCHCSENYQDINGTCVECKCGIHGKCVSDVNSGNIICKCDTGYAQNSKGVCQYCYCGDNSNCSINDEGRKKCSCPPGYRDTNGFCTDINECAEGLATCLSSETCKNIPGGAFCACADGYGKTDRGCEDIDECVLGNPCKNKGTECLNTPGSYECKCKKGYLARGGDKSDLECQKNSAAKVGYALLSTLFTVIVLILSIIVYKKYRR